MRVVALVALAGCSSWLGLDSTTEGTDQDGDGVYDTVDNCPATPNPTQANLDGDDIGDACELCDDGSAPTFRDLDRDGVDDGCDTCLSGRNDFDEDGDAVPDACDNCPAVPNPAVGTTPQADADGDRLGDACDPSSSAETRRYFEGFALDLKAWTTTVPWSNPDGTARSPQSPQGVTSKLELYSVRLIAGPLKPEMPPPPGVWSATVGIVIPADTSDFGMIGIELLDTFQSVSCGIRLSGGSFELGLSGGTGLVQFVPLGPTLDGLVHLQVRRGTTTFDMNNSPRYALECALVGTAAKLVDDNNQFQDRWRVRLFADAPTQFTYVDTISNQ